jgi:hypothetical protein
LAQPPQHNPLEARLEARLEVVQANLAGPAREQWHVFKKDQRVRQVNAQCQRFLEHHVQATTKLQPHLLPRRLLLQIVV